tara:strand:+ start:3208 stop:4347 length:1140 start_codon:yes stop_codon:yes gene_type:complete
MERQKICIIGASLTGLITAISLSRLNCKIDLIMSDNIKIQQSNRTTAISNSNFDYLNSLNISKSFKKYVWPCSFMELYTEDKKNHFSKVFEFKNKSENVLYMMENKKILNLMINKIKKIKNISLIKNEFISKINGTGLLKNIKIKNNSNKYNLIIVCTGNNSSLVKDIFNESIIKNSYKEMSCTTILKHKSLKNNSARQVFLNDGIMALLPISNTKTSVVLSIKKKNIDSSFVMKNKIKIYAKDFLKNITFLTDLKFRDLNFLIRSKYYKDRVLLFGDTLHTIHPFIGQGFNMTLRDLSSLERILRKKISLGLDIGSDEILYEFSAEAKPRNFLFSTSSNILKNTFSYNILKNDMLKILNNNNFVKNIFFNIADKGFKF